MKELKINMTLTFNNIDFHTVNLTIGGQVRVLDYDVTLEAAGDNTPAPEPTVIPLSERLRDYIDNLIEDHRQ